MERPIFDRLIHVPGPNPILRCGGPGAWDETNIESCNVFKDGHVYYLYYHGVPVDAERWGPGGYRTGVATAQHPLGPWTKVGDAPVIDTGPAGSWDSKHAACAAVLKERGDTYTLWYSGYSEETGVWSIGLATGDGPAGPWTKHEGNPIMENFGYLGGVVKVRGEYWMYVEHPISGASPDQGPFCVAMADSPAGPWRQHEMNPILPAGDWGAWDDGGYSEAGVLYHEGVFHTFYGGTKWYKLESVGYAYSFDGIEFHRHPANPVIPRERCPDLSALAEVHALFEPPLFCLYHTIRYLSRPGEEIGAQVLATSVPFKFDMPVLVRDCLEPGETTALEACAPIGLDNVNSLSLTVEGVWEDGAKAAMKVEVFPSHDGVTYDTEPADALTLDFRATGLCRKSFPLPTTSRFLRVTLANPDVWASVTDVKVTATLGCS